MLIGNLSLKSDHEVKVFLINKGVEIEAIKDEKYNVKEQADSFIENKGQWNNSVLFKAPIPGGDLYILKNKLKYVFYKTEQKGHEGLIDEKSPALRKNSISRNEKLIHAVELSFQNSNSGLTFIGQKI